MHFEKTSSYIEKSALLFLYFYFYFALCGICVIPMLYFVCIFMYHILCILHVYLYHAVPSPDLTYLLSSTLV